MKKILIVFFYFFISSIYSQSQKIRIEDKIILAKNHFYNNEFQKTLNTISDIEKITKKPSRIDVLILKINTLIKIGAISFAQRQIEVVNQLKISETDKKNLIKQQDSIKSFLKRQKQIERHYKISEYNNFNSKKISYNDSLTFDENQKLNSFVKYITGTSDGCYKYIPEFNYSIDNYIKLINNSTNLEAYIFLINQSNDAVYRFVNLKIGEMRYLRNIPTGKYILNIARGNDLQEIPIYSYPDCYYYKFKTNASYSISKEISITPDSTSITLDLDKLILKDITEKEFNLEK